VISLFVKNEIERLLQFVDEDCISFDFLLCCPGFLGFPKNQDNVLVLNGKIKQNSSQVTKTDTSRFKTAISDKSKKLSIFTLMFTLLSYILCE